MNGQVLQANIGFCPTLVIDIMYAEKGVWLENPPWVFMSTFGAYTPEVGYSKGYPNSAQTQTPGMLQKEFLKLKSRYQEFVV